MTKIMMTPKARTIPPINDPTSNPSHRPSDDGFTAVVDVGLLVVGLWPTVVVGGLLVAVFWLTVVVFWLTVVVVGLLIVVFWLTVVVVGLLVAVVVVIDAIVELMAVSAAFKVVTGMIKDVLFAVILVSELYRSVVVATLVSF